MSLQDWTDEAADALDVDADFDIRTLLDLTRDVAHGVERPAGPVTTFLLGWATAQRGGSREDFDAVIEEVRAALAQWQPGEE